jgi:putative drug exporter of the RND superfamily
MEAHLLNANEKVKTIMQVQERITKTLVDTLEPVASLETHALYRVGLAYGRLVYRIRWFLIAFWIVVVILSIPFASKITSVLQGGGYTYNSGESTHVDTVLTTKLHQSPSQAVVVFQSTTTLVNDPSYQKEVNDFMSRARSFQDVTTVAQRGTGTDGRTTFVIVTGGATY